MRWQMSPAAIGLNDLVNTPLMILGLGPAAPVVVNEPLAQARTKLGLVPSSRFSAGLLVVVERNNSISFNQVGRTVPNPWKEGGPATLKAEAVHRIQPG